MWTMRIRLAGSGGQGLGLAAGILAEAALRTGCWVTLLRAYGPEARGGASRSDVTLADHEIASPWFSQPSLLVALNDKAWHKFGEALSADAVAIVDRDWVGAVDRPNVYALPLERVAKSELREKLAANMVAVGAAAVILERIPLEVLLATAERRAPQGFAPINTAAIRLGWQLMQNRKEGSPDERLGGP